MHFIIMYSYVHIPEYCIERVKNTSKYDTGLRVEE